ncbi:uncharacterized protein VP01_5503g1 [Puccinia sorghi]|uniref:HAT C-terminal dimerisation domain-containing protein n=1 Tax=Puccinia sorghi TaxID=27349 RepID=A0A0L6ULE6_9BASI|nr:uncharacterized protein VP01_5503g1 [Puccinia sorghi]
MWSLDGSLAGACCILQKSNTFYKIVKGMFGKNLSMVASVSAQWNSTFAMLASNFSLTPEEWSKMKQLCAFLEPLNKATKLFSSDQTISLSTLLVSTYCKLYDAQELILASHSMLQKLLP